MFVARGRSKHNSHSPLFDMEIVGDGNAAVRHALKVMSRTGARLTARAHFVRAKIREHWRRSISLVVHVASRVFVYSMYLCICSSARRADGIAVCPRETCHHD